MAYAVPTPNTPMSTPPIPGPMTIVSWYRPKLSAMAERSRAGSTRLGRIAERVTFCSAPKPASRPPSTYRTATGGEPAKASAASVAEQATSAIWSSSSTRRRSVRSAIAPPSSAIVTSGMSSTAPSSPVRKAEPVWT